MKKKLAILLCFTFLTMISVDSNAGWKDKLRKAKNKTLIKMNLKKDKEKKRKKAAKKEKARIAALNKEAAAEKAIIVNLKKQLKNLKTESALSASKATATVLKAQSEPKIEGKPVQVIENGIPITYVTTTQRFKASAAFNKQILLNPSTDVIYPGSVILAHTIEDGSYKEIYNGEKRPISVSYDLTGIKASSGKTRSKVSGTIVPTLSNFRKLHNRIMSQDIAGKSSNYSFEETTVTDESEFGVKFNLGVGYSSPAVESSVKAGFDFKKSTKKYKHMIKFMETFYTVDVNQGQDTFLYKKFNIADFKGYRPVYVSSISYGRLAYLTIESDEDLQTVKATLEAAVESKVGNTKYDADFETNYNTFKKNSKINITVIGGSKVATTLDGFMNMLKNDSFSAQNPGKIVAYKLRFVDDNRIANTIYNSEYTVRQTTAMKGNGIDLTFTLFKIQTNAEDGAGKKMELYGNLMMGVGDKGRDLWNKSRKRKWKCKEHGTYSKNDIAKFHVANEQGRFSAKLFLMEKDGSKRKDDHFCNLTGSGSNDMKQEYQISNYKDGSILELKVYQMKKSKNLPNEWVKFFVRINKKYNY